MANNITPDTREAVIRDYISGVEVEQIIKDHRISQSSFYSIIKDGKAELGKNSIEAMRNITSLLREKNIPPGMILNGARIAFYLDSLEPSKRDALLGTFTNLAENYSAGQLSEVIPKLAKLSQKYPSENLSDIPSLVDEMAQQKSKLEEQIESDKAEVKKIKQQKEAALKDDRTTEAEIANFVRTRKYLRKNGYDISNLDSSVTMIKECETLGYDPSKAVESLQKESSLEQRVHDLSKKEDTLSNQISQKESELKEITSKLENLQREANQYSAAIDFLNSLESRGIPPKRIERWQNIIKSAGLDPIQFSQDMEELKDISKVKNKVHERYCSLKSEVARLESQRNTLAEEVKKLESKTNTLRVIEKRLQELINSMSHEFHKMSSKFQTTLDWQTAGAQEYLKKIINEFEDLLNDLLNRLVESNDAVSKADIFKPLYRIMKGDKPEPYKVYWAMFTMLSSLKIWIKNQDVGYALKSEVSSITERLQKMLMDGAAA